MMSLAICSAQAAVDPDILNPDSPDQQPSRTADPNGSADPTKGTMTTPPVVYTPWTVGQKFKAATRDTIGPFALAGVGVAAGYAQLANTPSEWGQGAVGYGRRYGNAFGVNLSYQYFNATLESVLHEDPRYFPSVDRSAKARIRHAVAQTFLTRKDDGTDGFAYGRWVGAFGAGFLSNTWNPRSNNHASDALETGGAIIGLNFALKLGQEFIPFLRHLNP
jgi:hypothetical protein